MTLTPRTSAPSHPGLGGKSLGNLPMMDPPPSARGPASLSGLVGGAVLLVNIQFINHINIFIVLLTNK